MFCLFTKIYWSLDFIWSSSLFFHCFHTGCWLSYFPTSPFLEYRQFFLLFTTVFFRLFISFLFLGLLLYRMYVYVLTTSFSIIFCTCSLPNISVSHPMMISFIQSWLTAILNIHEIVFRINLAKPVYFTLRLMVFFEI
jgi:hypothetical protein